MKLNKKDAEGDFWPRLLLDKHLEKTNVKVDWDRYVDEDEAEGKDFDVDGFGNMDFGNMDFSNLGGMGGQPPMGEEEDSDDDEKLPDLESTAAN